MTQKYQYHNIQYTGLHVSVEDINMKILLLVKGKVKQQCSHSKSLVFASFV